MKRFILISVAVLLSAQIASADGYPKTFSDAVQSYSHGNFKKAKELFVACQSSDDFDPVNISIWIGRCDTGLQEQRRDAQAAERKRQAKLAQRIQNGYVYISVNAAESGDLFETTKSAMSEVMRLNGRTFCPNIDDALTIVTVYLNTKQDSSDNGFYKATGEGFVQLGSAIDEKEFVGQWSVDGEATSAVNMEDAVRLLRNKLNYKLRYALENLLNRRPQGQDFYIPEQSISVYFAQNNSYNEEELSFLRESLNGYISKTPGLELSTALDKTRNQERDAIAQLQAQYVKRESRAPVHELEGFGQILRISVKKEYNGYITIVGEISELGTGKSLTTVTINGSDFNISEKNILTPSSQELASKIMAVGFGFKKWIPGEDIGGYKLASFDGLHGLVLRIMSADFLKIETIDALRRRDKTLDNEWRYPHTEELLEMFDHKKVLGLASVFWSADVPANRMHEAVDFRSPKKEEATKRYKDSKAAAALLLVREF